MRKATPDVIATKRLELARLRQDWPRMNRPHVSKDLKASLFTRLSELAAEIEGMEATLKPPRSSGRRSATAEAARS